jgi:Zn-dependent protease with chaperone function
MNQSPETKGRTAIKRAFSSSDLVVLAVTYVVFFLASTIYLIVTSLVDTFNETYGSPTLTAIITALIGAFVAGLVIFVITLGIGMFSIRMMRQTMLGNALQIEYSDYAWLRDWANQVSADLGLPRVEIFITQDPYINAYAFGFIRPYCIVLQSGTIRYLTKDEIKAVTVHEMGHIKYAHTIASLYLIPFLNFPFLGTVFGWIAGFWQRRSELTADRLALMYMGDPELVKAALIKVHVGPDAASSMNDVARQWLQYNAERPMNHLAQTFSSHPFLVRRLSHIDKWKSVVAQPVTPQTQSPVTPTPTQQS